MEWLNYPGLEAWKFVNLTIFTAAAIYVLRRKINEALLARRESIRQELVAAQNEREQASARVAEADALLSRLDDDVSASARGVVLHEGCNPDEHWLGSGSSRQKLRGPTHPLGRIARCSLVQLPPKAFRRSSDVV